MFLCNDPEKPKEAVQAQAVQGASVAARAAARTADRTGVGSCCDVLCADELQSRHRPARRIRQQERSDKILRPDTEGEAKAKLSDEADFLEPRPTSNDTEICVFLEKAEGLPQADFLGTADPYVEISLMSCDPLKIPDLKMSDLKNLSGPLSDSTLFKATSRIVRGSLSPQWNQAFYFCIPEADLTVYLRVLDYDLVVSDDFLGHCSFGVLDALGQRDGISAGWHALIHQGTPGQKLAALRDPHVAEAEGSTPSVRLRAAPGQESTYDLSSAKIFVKVSLTGRSIRPLLQSSTREGREGREVREADCDEPAFLELVEVIQKNDIWGALRLLSSKRVSVNTKVLEGAFQGYTALLIACSQKHAEMVKALVDIFKASLVVQAPGGRTAAMLACSARAEGLAEWLISEGVPADLTDDAGRNVLFYAVQEAFPQLTAFLLSKQRLSPMTRALDGSSPLSLAVSTEHTASVVVAKQLLEAKATPDSSDNKGNLPLHEACRAGNDKCVKLLHSHSHAALLGALDSEGQVPYSLAKAAGLPEATLKLLQPGKRAAKPSREEPKSSRQLGESFEEAEKRELRARKAAISAEAEASWQAWRMLHPRTDAALEKNGLGKDEDDRAAKPFKVEDLEDPFFALSQPSRAEDAQATTRRRSDVAKKSWRVAGFCFSAKGASSPFNLKSWMKRSARAQSYSPDREEREEA
ncbi:Putative ankyrin repeat protein RBE_0220 [Durusdinium trenchii]|uniref:Ankyrin repeat protein RBE_0220 n=1 Tax=Durusdinium trenchii TaxID=1381693 RepID=A0ABP0RJY3_9DINO